MLTASMWQKRSKEGFFWNVFLKSFRKPCGLALKTEDFSKKSVVLVNANMDVLKPSPGQKTLEE